MGRRTLLLIASILVAALGTALIWLYVQGADTRAQAGEAEVRVWVAGAQVKAGDPAGNVQARARTVPQSVAGAFGQGLVTDPGQIKGYARTDIVAGMPLLADQFVATPPTPAPPVQLAPDKIALQMSLPDPQRLAGLLQPGSMIRIYVATKTSSGAAPKAQVLLDHIRVLASGPVAQGSAATATSGSASDGKVPQANVVLEVDNDDAKKLVQSQTQGSSGGANTLWFGLLGSKVPVLPGFSTSAG